MNDRQRKYTMNDIRPNDIELLSMAASIDVKTFFCFGNAWLKLFSLELIDDYTQVTPLGLILLQKWNRSH